MLSSKSVHPSTRKLAAGSGTGMCLRTVMALSNTTGSSTQRTALCGNTSLGRQVPTCTFATSVTTGGASTRITYSLELPKTTCMT